MSENKMRKVSKKLHWGRGKSFLKKNKIKIRGISFYNSADRLALKETLCTLK